MKAALLQPPHSANSRCGVKAALLQPPHSLSYCQVWREGTYCKWVALQQSSLARRCFCPPSSVKPCTLCTDAPHGHCSLERGSSPYAIVHAAMALGIVHAAVALGVVHTVVALGVVHAVVALGVL